MSCKFDKNIIQKYIDNEIDPLEMIFLQEHIKYCAECKKEMELLTLADQQIFNLYNDIAMPANLDIFREEIIDQCIEESKNRSKLSATIHKGYKISRDILNNTGKAVGYIPGTKLVAKGVSKSTAYVKNSAKNYIKNKFKQAMTSRI